MAPIVSMSALLVSGNGLSALIRQASPDSAILLASAGVCLVFVECNRPGLVLPAALGLLAMLCSAASLLQHSLCPWALGLLAACATTLALNVWEVLPPWLLAGATAGLIVGLRFLLASSPAQRPIHNATALTCGAALGLPAAVLSRIALRARRAKAVH